MVLSDVQSSKRIEYPTSYPSLTPISSATRAATDMAATRPGLVKVLRNLSGLARTSFAHNDKDLELFDGLKERIAVLVNGERLANLVDGAGLTLRLIKQLHHLDVLVVLVFGVNRGGENKVNLLLLVKDVVVLVLRGRALPGEGASLHRGLNNLLLFPLILIRDKLVRLVLLIATVERGLLLLAIDLAFLSDIVFGHDIPIRFVIDLETSLRQFQYFLIILVLLPFLCSNALVPKQELLVSHFEAQQLEALLLAQLEILLARALADLGKSLAARPSIVGQVAAALRIRVTLRGAIFDELEEKV
ncbi:hypothetical protein BC937DRAFT_89744 [Endogone sp. FLAS-F59071]|nr:hypothetical protein BC937DRAFT_89744 [Endogone sp. FLAS-F59071]|eukprot:RUS17613.1 hypothetical protein BC937DRAFT_89744 [Endogone sp. FLAS-F59071]